MFIFSLFVCYHLEGGGGVPHLHPIIILLLVPCHFWGLPQGLVPGRFLEGVPQSQVGGMGVSQSWPGVPQDGLPHPVRIGHTPPLDRLHLDRLCGCSTQGSHFFPLTKFPDFSSIFFIFPLPFSNIFYGFYSIFILLCMASTYYWVVALQVYIYTKYFFYNTQ